MATDSRLDSVNHLGRISIESGTLNIRGALINAGYNTASETPDSAHGYGIAIGAAAGTGQGAVTIASGSVLALGDPRAEGAGFGGIVFGTESTHQGGVLNLNGGTLEVSNIRSNTDNDTLNLSGGTINVSTRLSGATAYGEATDAQLQSRLDHFITGFSGSGENYINLVSGYTTFDLSAVDIGRTNGTATIDSAIRGPGELRMSGTNRTLVLRGTNSYAKTTVLSGTVVGDSDSLPMNIQRNMAGTVVFDQDFDGSYSGTLMGAGGFVKKGGGTLAIRISGTDTVQGPMQIEGGTVELTNLAASFTKNVTNNATLVFNPSATGTYAGVISGSGALVKKGAAMLSLTGNNSYSGDTRVEAGALEGNINSIKGDLYIATDAYVDLRQVSGGVNETFSGNLSGSGTLRKWLAGLTTLTGSNAAFTGILYVVSGTLVGNTDSLVGNIQRNAAGGVVFDQDFDGAYSGTFINHGTIIKRGVGTVVVSSSANGNPTVNVEGGALLAVGSGAYLGGGITTVKAGATAGGNGKFSTLTASAGAAVQVGPDNSAAPETLTISTRLTTGSAAMRFDLFAGDQSDYINATALTNNGGNIIDIGAFATGTFKLGSAATGTLAANSKLYIDGFEAVPGARRNGALSNNSGLQLVTTQGNNIVSTWRGAASGTWDPTQANWAGDAPGLFAMGDHAVLDDTIAAGPRSISVAAPGVTVSDLTVTGTGAYTLAGAGITADAASATGLAGATGRLIKTDSGTLTLANAANDFRGGVSLGGGVLALGAGVSLGSGTLAVTAANTTLRATGGNTLPNAIALSTNGLTVDTGANIFALTGNITGAAKITKTGAGELALSGNNNFAGVDLASGTLAVANAAAAGSTLKADGAGGALRFAADGIALASAIDLSANGLSVGTGTFAATLAGALSGSGSLDKTGSGTLALTADNSAFTGAVAVREGALQIASLNNLGSGAGALDIASGATLTLSQAAPGGATLARALAGGGRLDIALAAGADKFAFAATANSAFTGTVALGRGTLDLDAANLGALSRATLSLSGGATGAVTATGSAGGLAMDGGLLKIEMNAAGDAPQNLLSVGSLAISSGTVALNLAALDGAPVVNPGSPHLFDRTQVSSIRLVAAGAVSGTDARLELVKPDGSAFALPVRVDVSQAGAAGAETVGKADYNYIAQAAEGGLYLGSGLTQVEIFESKTLLLDNTGAAGSDFQARLTGAGGVEIRATGTVTLSHADNDFAGPALLASGALKVTRENALASSAAVTLAGGSLLDATDLSQELANLSGAGGILIGTGTLTLRSTADTAYDGVIQSATGARIIKTGAADIRLGGDNALSGFVEVREGLLHVVDRGSYSDVDITINTGATLALEGFSGRDLSAAIAGGGTLALINSSVRLGAANTLAAVALQDNAHAQIANVGALGGTASTVSVSGGSVLELLSPDSGTMIVAAATVVVDGGKLLFGQDTVLSAAKTVSFVNHGAVGLSGPLQTGVYTIITTGSGITSDNHETLLPDYNPAEFGMGVHLSREGKTLVMEVYNQSANPAKDVALAYDTVLASVSAVQSRMSESFFAPFTGRDKGDPARDFWLKGFGTIGDYKQTSMQTGFTDRTQGVMAGYDRVFAEKTLLGAWAGIASGRLETDNHAYASVDQQLFGAYAAMKLGRWHAGLDASAGFAQADTSRREHVGAAIGCYEVAVVSAGAELGFTLGSWERGSARPSASLHYMGLRYKNQREKGDGAMRVADFSHDFWQSFVRLQATQGFDLPWGREALLDVSAGWRQNLTGDATPVRMEYVSNPGVFIDAETGGYVRGAAVLGLGLRTAITRLMSLALAYDFEVAAARQRHTASLTARWNW
ncbi:autotransporter-associated beta strand repeat-containing protein [Termitidicoccus mucosus]